MKYRYVARGVVAVAAAFAFVFLAAGPATSAEIVSGSWDVGSPVQWPLSFKSPTNRPCDPGPKGFPPLEPNPYPEVELHVRGDNQTGDWWTTGISTATFSVNAGPGLKWYQITLLLDDFAPGFTTGLAGNYQWNAALGRWDLTGDGTIWFRIEEINDPVFFEPEEPCEKLGQVCFGLVSVVLTAPSHYSGNWAPPGPPGFLTISANSTPPHVTTPGCEQPFLAMNGESLMITSMTINLNA